MDAVSQMPRVRCGCKGCRVARQEVKEDILNKIITYAEMFDKEGEDLVQYNQVAEFLYELVEREK
jgi:hypothetical protein